MELDPVNSRITLSAQDIDALGDRPVTPPTLPFTEAPALLDRAMTRFDQMTLTAGRDVSEFPDYARKSTLLGQIRRAEAILPVLRDIVGKLCEIVPDGIGPQAEAFLLEQGDARP